MVSKCQYISNKRYAIANPLIEKLSSKIHIWGLGIQRGCVNRHPNIIDHGPAQIDQLYVSYYDVDQSYIKDCKFYLAFENANCSEYLTEKFANSLETGAIPIVNGWLDTYKELLPGSYIHVSDFADMSQLATYLGSLLADESKMKEYHSWRKY